VPQAAALSPPKDLSLESAFIPPHDYEKMFCADIKAGNDIFAMRGVDREAGCMVIVA
jgi:hypothetical protein